jgi:O-antigen/teichoic acid export membrane protein
VRKSLPLAAIWFLIILVRHIDPLILGALYSGKIVGNYGFAYENAFRVSEILVPAVVRSLYPALVAFGGELTRLFRAYGLATIMMLSLEVPAALFLFLNADLAILILGGRQWEGAPTFLRILCFAPLADPFSRLGGELLKARHRDTLWIASSLVTLATFLIGGVMLTRALGPVGMAWINLLPLGGILMAWGIYQMGPSEFRKLLGDIAFVYLVPVPFFATAWLLSGDRVVLRLLLSLACVGICLWIFGRRFGGQFRTFFRPPTGEPDQIPD